VLSVVWLGLGVFSTSTVRDVSFGEDACASRTGSGPVNLATIRVAVTTALKTSATCTFLKAAATTPPPPRSSAFTAWIKDRCGYSRYAGALHPSRRLDGQVGFEAVNRLDVERSEPCNEWIGRSPTSMARRRPYCLWVPKTMSPYAAWAYS
jgi:hypothetical protein